MNGFTGGSTYNTARLFISANRWRNEKSRQVCHRAAAPQLAKITWRATLYLQAARDVRVGGRQSNAQYQFTMQGDNLDDLNTFALKMVEEFKGGPIIADVSSASAKTAAYNR